MKTCSHLAILLLLQIIVFTKTYAQAGEEKEILQLVEKFFLALEKQDTAAFKNLFVQNGYIYAVWEENPDSVVVRSHPSSVFRLRAGQIVKERMRKKDVVVKTDGRVAMAWVPYDLWVNDTFSHCGVDVFAFLKSSGGWKITSISYNIVLKGCK